MTISTALRKAGPYTGDGQTQTYPFGFKVFDAGDVKAVASDALGNERALTASVDYSVTINPDQRQNPGGSVVLTRALPSRHRLSIISQMDFVQPVEFTNQGGFYPRVLNDSLDRLTMYTQQLDELLGRAVTLSVNHAGTYVSFPAAIPDNLLSWNSKGELVNWDLHSIVSDAIDNGSSAHIASSKAVKIVYDKTVENTNDIDSERLRVDGIISKVNTITGGVDLSKILSIVELTNQNLDSLTDTSNCGIYGQTNASNANVSAGYPVAKAGTLIVLPSQNGVQQLYYPHGSAFYYARGKASSGWGNWVSAENAVQQQLDAQNQSFAKIKLLALAGL